MARINGPDSVRRSWQWYISETLSPTSKHYIDRTLEDTAKPYLKASFIWCDHYDAYLFMDEVLVYDSNDEPKLFILRGDDERCAKVLAYKVEDKKWLVVPVSDETLNKIKTSQLPIFYPFFIDTECIYSYLVKQDDMFDYEYHTELLYSSHEDMYVSSTLLKYISYIEAHTLYLGRDINGKYIIKGKA